MSKIHGICLLVAVVLTLYTTNVQAIDIPALKTAFTNFFDGLEGICGRPGGIPTARNTYNSCAENATTYEALVECVTTAYNTYHNYVLMEVSEKSTQISALRTQLLSAIIAATPDGTAEQRLIPIRNFRNLSVGADTLAYKTRSDRER